MENNSNNSQRINEMIRVSQVRVISSEGEQLGVMATSEALARAHEAGLDLVEVAPDAKPPVCKIMDFGKFKYQQRKKTPKQQAPSRLKEIRMRPKTGEADVMVKINRGREFLTKKEKLLVSINFRGREFVHIEEGTKLMEYVIEKLSDVARIEAPPKQFGKKISCTLAPK